MILLVSEEEFNNAKSCEKLKLQCEHCGKEFYAEKKYIAYEQKNQRGRLKYCSNECFNHVHNCQIETTCALCGKEIKVSNSEFQRSKSKRFFCCQSHAATYNNLHRGKIVRKSKPQPKIKKKRICQLCGKEYEYTKGTNTKKFCSKQCSDEYRKNRKKYLSEETKLKLHNGGVKSIQAQKDKRRSKNEIYFAELCQNKYNVLLNEVMFNGWDADVILLDRKIAVLWNGAWHYKEISNKISLSQIQNRDKIKISEIEKCGYKPYIIKDLGKHNTKFVENEFKKFELFLEKNLVD